MMHIHRKPKTLRQHDRFQRKELVKIANNIRDMRNVFEQLTVIDHIRIIEKASSEIDIKKPITNIAPFISGHFRMIQLCYKYALEFTETISV